MSGVTSLGKRGAPKICSALYILAGIEGGDRVKKRGENKLLFEYTTLASSKQCIFCVKIWKKDDEKSGQNSCGAHAKTEKTLVSRSKI